MTVPTWNLGGLVLAIVGGDRREQEIAREAVRSGATVRIHGFPVPAEGIAGATLADSPQEAAKDADVLLLPLPSMIGSTVFSPEATGAVVVDNKVLSVMRAGGVVLGGSADAAFEKLIVTANLAFIGYEHDEEGRIARAPAIAEGAIARIVSETQRTINGANIVQIGYGVVGRQLADTLRALGAHTAVSTRDPIRQEEARARGHLCMSNIAVTTYLADADLLINTVPALVVNERLLSAIPEGCLVIDLASPPGGVDREAAVRLRRRVVWARGMGATSPVSVGRTQWAVVAKLITKYVADGRGLR